MSLRIIPIGLLILSFQACTKKPCLELTAREGVMRSYASKIVLPDYPAEAQKANAAGVAVAKIRVDENGAIRAVQILQAPHPAIAEATTAALKKWVFNLHATRAAQQECHTGKITFYFVMENGNAYVRNPKVFE